MVAQIRISRYGHVQELGDEEGGCPQRRRREQGTDAGCGQDATRLLSRIARPPQQGP